LPTTAEEQEMNVEAVTESARRRRRMLRDPGVMRGTDYQSGLHSVNVWNDYLTDFTVAWPSRTRSFSGRRIAGPGRNSRLNTRLG
jgi:hypothetical protein